MYQYFHKLRVRFAELEMKQGEVAKRANMAESTLTARMTGRLPWNGDEIARVAKVLDIPTDQIGAFWCCTIKVDIENSKGQYIEKDKQEATKDGSESTKIQHGI